MRAIVGLRKPHLAGCVWFWVWAVVGVGFAFSFVSFLGLLTILPVALVIFFLARLHPINGFGLLSGAGAMLLVVAYLQRQGPGTTCWHTATASGCDQHLNPIPWLVAGLVCFTAGVAGHAWRSRRL